MLLIMSLASILLPIPNYCINALFISKVNFIGIISIVYFWGKVGFWVKYIPVFAKLIAKQGFDVSLSTIPRHRLLLLWIHACKPIDIIKCIPIIWDCSKIIILHTEIRIYYLNTLHRLLGVPKDIILEYSL